MEWEKIYLKTYCTFKPELGSKHKADKSENVMERLTAPKAEPKPIKNPNCTFKPNLVHLHKKK